MPSVVAVDTREAMAVDTREAMAVDSVTTEEEEDSQVVVAVTVAVVEDAEEVATNKPSHAGRPSVHHIILYC
jgi:hypothetical protein